MTTTDLLWPACARAEDLPHVEEIPLEARGLPASTYELVARAAALWPHRPATSFLPDAERWQRPSTRTFAQLAGDVHRVAHVLAAFGVRRRDAVALVSVNCEQLHTALLAAEAVGVAAPINPALAPEHAAQLIELAAARVIVAAGPALDPGSWALARRLAARTGVVALLALRPLIAEPDAPALEPLEGVTVQYLDELARAAPDAGLPGEPPGPADLASYLHTGGTTGTPKLAARTHANEVTNSWMVASTSALDEDSTLFAALPLFHTNALIVTLLGPLLRGQHVVWAGPRGYRDVPLYGVFWRLVERYRIAAMSAVPTVYAVLAHVPLDADIGSLKYPIVGAAPLPRSVVDGFRERTGRELCEGYGLTEGTCASSRNFPGAVRRGTVGQRLPYQQVMAVRIAQATGEWEPLAAGEVGTLVIKGPNVFAGYLVPGRDGPVPEHGDKVRDGWLDTGDLGAVDADGYLRLAGRAKDLIIRGGHNIDPAVIEDALLAHPAVTAAGAVGLPDAHAGEVPVAYVALAADSTASEDELRSWAAARVPEPAAAPKLVEVVDAIPLTSIGKPYKPELRRRATERAARDALPEHARVEVEIVDGAAVVTVSGVPAAAIRQALAPFTFQRRTHAPQPPQTAPADGRACNAKEHTMSEQDLQTRFQGLPATVRDRVNTALTDAKVALKVRVGETLANREQHAEHAVTTAGRVGAKSGEVSELTAILPLKPGGAERLRKFFRLIDGNLAGAGQVGTLHNMRFVFLDNDTKLLFATAYDGEWDPYIDDFATQIPEMMDYLFGNVEGWPGIVSPDVKDFIVGHQLPAEAWYVAHPSLTVSEASRLTRQDKAVQHFVAELN
jgi:fatty-acyl-CoA synthase